MTLQPINFIDTHVHFWDLKVGNYRWIATANPPHWPDKTALQRDFLPADLVTSKDLKLQGVVHIEAGFDNNSPHLEVQWLSQIAEQLHCPLAIVPCVDLLQPTEIFKQSLQKLTAYPSVIGVRHILDEQASQILGQPQAQINLAQIAQADLLFEAQIFLADRAAVEALSHLAKNNQRMTIVVNHLGFSAQMDDRHSKLAAIRMLAKNENIVVKASGWEMTDSHNRSRAIADFERDLIEFINIFGDDRVLFGSNFPVCTLAKSYAEVWQYYANLPITDEQRIKCLYSNALRVYFSV